MLQAKLMQRELERDVTLDPANNTARDPTPDLLKALQLYLDRCAHIHPAAREPMGFPSWLPFWPPHEIKYIFGLVESSAGPKALWAGQIPAWRFLLLGQDKRRLTL